MLEETGEFYINLTTEALAFATDYCGVKSGRDVDKFEVMHLNKEAADQVEAPMIAESPVNIECRVRECMELGSHHMFLADVLAVHVDEAYLDEKDEEKRTAYLVRAAAMGCAPAQNQLGYCYDSGTGVPKDPAQATSWYRKAAEQGFATAQYNLGVCYKNGTGVPKDTAQAAAWYRKAAGQGHANAKQRLETLKN